MEEETSRPSASILIRHQEPGQRTGRGSPLYDDKSPPSGELCDICCMTEHQPQQAPSWPVPLALSGETLLGRISGGILLLSGSTVEASVPAKSLLP